MPRANECSVGFGARVRQRARIAYGIALFVVVAVGVLVPQRSRADCCFCGGCAVPACAPYTDFTQCSQFCMTNGGCAGFQFLNASCNANNGQCVANTPTATPTATETATGTATVTATATASDTPIATSTATATQTGTVTNTPPVTPTSTPVSNGGGCSTTSDCVAGNFCVDDVCCSDASCPVGSSCDNPGQVGMCAEDPIAPAPALSPRNLLTALAVLIALGGLAMLRRRRL